MRSLLLILAVVVCSNSFATRLKSPAYLKLLRQAELGLMTELGANHYLKSNFPALLNDKDILNRLTQLLIDEEMASADLLVVYRDGTLNFIDMNMARDQHDNKYQTSDNLDLLVDGHRDIVIGDLSKDISNDSGLTIHKRTNDKGELVAYISEYELSDGTPISQVLTQLEIKKDGLSDDESIAITAKKYSDGLRSDSSNARGLSSKGERVDIIPFTLSHMENTAANLDVTDPAAHSLYSFAANAITEAMNKEQLIWEGRGLGWQDFVTYINGGQSSRVLIEQRVKNGDEGDKELADKLDKELADKLKDILAGEEVLLSAADFYALINKTKIFGYDIRIYDGLMLETMLAIERVLAVHAEKVKTLGSDSYLYNIAPSKGQTYAPADLIRWANNVYRQGEVQLQPVKHQLPAVVHTTDKVIKQANRQEKVQEIMDMIDATKHLIYTDPFVSWLKKLDDELFELVKERLTILAAEENVDNIMNMKIEGKEIIKDLGRNSGLVEIIFPDIRANAEDTTKLRVYFLEWATYWGQYTTQEIILQGGSTQENNDKGHIEGWSNKNKNQQQPAINWIETRGITPELKKVPPEGLSKEQVSQHRRWWQEQTKQSRENKKQ